MNRHHHISTKGTRVSKLSHARHVSQFLAIAFVLFTAVLFLVAVAVLGASSASALTTRQYTGVSIGPEGTSGSAAFQSVQAVTVDRSTGDIYVLDAGEPGRLYKFNSAGEPADFSLLTGNVIEGVGGREGPGNQIAIAPPGSPGGTAGDIYLATFFGDIQIYGADGTKLGELEPPAGAVRPDGVATDAAGHLFVDMLSPATISEYTPTSNPPTAADLTASAALGNLPRNVVLDGAGNLYVAANSESATTELEGIADPSPTVIEAGGTSLAIDPVTNDLYLDQGSTVGVYSPSGEAKFHFGASGLEESHGIALNSSGETVYVTNSVSGKVDLYGPAVILPDVSTEPASEPGPESAVLHGTINAAGGPAASCEFQITTGQAFKEEGFTGARSVPCAPAGPFSGSANEAVSASVGDLAIGTVYYFRLIASNENGSDPVLTSKDGALSFSTVGPSVISSAVSDITASAATVTGLVKPNGQASSFHVEYGPTSGYGASVPVPDAHAELPLATGKVKFESSNVVRGVKFAQGMFVVGQEVEGEGVPAGTVITKVEGTSTTPEGIKNEPITPDVTLTLSAGVEFPFEESREVTLTSPTAAIAQRITGLASATQYHFRVVATSSVTAFGPDGSFTTFARAPGAGGRAYEMVSPAAKIGEVFPPEPFGGLGGTCTECLPGISSTRMPMQARADGEALAFEGEPFTAGLSAAGDEYLADRSSEGWAASPITPPSAPGIAGASGFKGFSADLSRGVLLQTRPKLSPQAPGEGQQSFTDLYRWEAGSPNLLPLVTVEPPNRPPVDENNRIAQFNVTFAGANSGSAGAPAFEHIVFEANDALTPAVPGVAPAAPEVGVGECEGASGSNCDLYEWVGGQLRLVNVLPGNAAAASGAVIGSGKQLAEAPSSGSAQETQAPDVGNAISVDGSRIFWSDEAGQVYVRIDGRETVKVNDPGRFLTATPDGTKVLLSDGCLYSLAAGACETRLTGSAAGFLGLMGASENLSRIYFVSTEALAAGAEPRACEAAENQTEREGNLPPGIGCNLYAYDNGTISFVAALSETDNNFEFGHRDGAWKASRSNRTAQVTPDGRYLTFMSAIRLTGYDSRRDDCGASHLSSVCLEVYEYDLQTGGLRCASCNPTGARPLGESNLSLIRQTEVSFPQPENLPASGEGRLFFESADALLPTDTNGVQDVYEWRPEGVGGCDREAGCLALISSGHSPNDSMFLTATPDAANAFFITREQLVSQDRDELLDVYDARVGGGVASGETAPCAGEGCKGVGAVARVFEPPASALFSGAGNLVSPASVKPKPKSKPLTRAQLLGRALKACRRDRVKKKRVVCEVSARKRYGLPHKVKAKGKGGK